VLRSSFVSTCLTLLVLLVDRLQVQVHAVVLVVHVFGLPFLLYQLFELADLVLDQFEHCLLVFRSPFGHLFFDSFPGFEPVSVGDIS
jgi:hypothetical protein